MTTAIQYPRKARVRFQLIHNQKLIPMLSKLKALKAYVMNSSTAQEVFEVQIRTLRKKDTCFRFFPSEKVTEMWHAGLKAPTIKF